MDGEIMAVDQKSRSFGLRLPATTVDRMDAECERRGISRTQYILSLLEDQADQEESGKQDGGFDLSFLSEIESLRTEIRGSLSASSSPDLTPVLDAIGDLSYRMESLKSGPAPSISDPPVDLSPLTDLLSEILEILRSGRSPGETETDAHALSFLSLQMGEIQQGIERLSLQMDGVVRAGKNNGAGTSPEIKHELIRLAESAEHQSALTGEILRIGDTVREIRDRLQKNPTTTSSSSPSQPAPEKVSRKEARSEELDPAAEKKAETRQWGWATGIILVLFFGFIAWQMLGWYNGGDSAGPQVSPKPAKPPESPSPPALKQLH